VTWPRGWPFAASRRFYHSTALNPYRVLSVNTDATPDEIKAAYRKQALRLHPDRPGGDAKQMRELTEAYEMLLRGNTFDANMTAWRTEADRLKKEAQRRQKAQWYNRQHVNHKKQQTDNAEEEDESTFGIFGRWGQDRRWWEEITSEERHRKLREKEINGKKVDLRDPFGLKGSRIILGTGIADGSIRW